MRGNASKDCEAVTVFVTFFLFFLWFSRGDLCGLKGKAVLIGKAVSEVQLVMMYAVWIHICFLLICQKLHDMHTHRMNVNSVNHKHDSTHKP